MLKIRDICEYEGEKVLELVKTFFKEKLLIKKTVEVADAFRIEKGQNRPIKVVLVNPRDKGLIFAGTKNLKDVVNEENESFFVDDQLTVRKVAEKKKMRQIMMRNRRLTSTADQLQLSFNKTEVGDQR